MVLRDLVILPDYWGLLKSRFILFSPEILVSSFCICDGVDLESFNGSLQ